MRQLLDLESRHLGHGSRPHAFRWLGAWAVILGAIISLGAAGGCSGKHDDMFSNTFTGGGVEGGAGSGGTGGESTSTSSSTFGTGATTTSSSTGPASSSASSSGGPVCGDGICNEDPATCGEDCACSHSVCTLGPALMPGCDPCVDFVCSKFGFCCSDDWDGQCIAGADQYCSAGCCGNGVCEGETCDSCPADCGACVCGNGKCEGETCSSCESDCGVCPPPPTCPHTVCLVSVEPLTTALCKDSCVDEVCQQEPACCGGANFTQSCEQLAAQLCPGGNPCVAAVCAALPECCTTGWTQACLDQAEVSCNTQCDCAHSVCQQGAGLAPACDPCVAAVCAVDDYCCISAWDDICLSELAAICGVDCG